MSRSVYQFNVADTNTAYNNMCYILSQKGFKNVLEKNENVWKWGTGLMTAVKYIKIEIPADHVILVSAWIRPLLWDEMPLDNSFVGVLPKEELKGVINVLQTYIR